MNGYCVRDQIVVCVPARLNFILFHMPACLAKVMHIYYI